MAIEGPNKSSIHSFATAFTGKIAEGAEALDKLMNKSLFSEFIDAEKTSVTEKAAPSLGHRLLSAVTLKNLSTLLIPVAIARLIFVCFEKAGFINTTPTKLPEEKVYLANATALETIPAFAEKKATYEENVKALDKYKSENPDWEKEKPLSKGYKTALKKSNEAKAALKGGQARKFAQANYEIFESTLISAIPNVRLDTHPSTSAQPEKNDLNNNGLKVDGKDLTFSGATEKIIQDGKEIELKCVTHATIDGKAYDFTQGVVRHAFFDGERLYPQKDDARYHDHVVVSGGSGTPATITLCDGSGHSEGARIAAVKASESANASLAASLAGCSTSHEVLKAQMQALKDASQSLEGDPTRTGVGHTTYIQTTLVGNLLSGVIVGDSKAYIFRPKEGGGWTSIDPTGNIKGTLDPRVAGGQLSNSSELHKTHLFVFPLQPGDVVYVCSDGIVDNLDPSVNGTSLKTVDPNNTFEEWEMNNPEHIELSVKNSTDRLDSLIQECKNGAEISEAINAFIENLTLNKKINFMSDPFPTDEKNSGKLDDAASAYVTYAPFSS